jgi:hypothetical protein
VTPDDALPDWSTTDDEAADLIKGLLGTEVAQGQLGSLLAGRLITKIDQWRGAPPTGHVCPVPYGLGLDDLAVLERMARTAALCGPVRDREVLDRIIAHHRSPGRDEAS